MKKEIEKIDGPISVPAPHREIVSALIQKMCRTIEESQVSLAQMIGSESLSFDSDVNVELRE